MKETFAVEVQMTRGFVCYLTSLNDSQVKHQAGRSLPSGKISWHTTRQQYPDAGVPTEARKFTLDRAHYLSTLMNQYRRVTKVVLVGEE